MQPKLLFSRMLPMVRSNASLSKVEAGISHATVPAMTQRTFWRGRGISLAGLCVGMHGVLLCLVSGQGIATSDFAVTRFEMDGSSRVQTGAEIGDRITVEIANEGEAMAIIPSSVGFYVSADQDITTEDTLLVDGSKRLQRLQSGSSTELKPKATARLPEDFSPGPAYLGVLVDDLDVVPEGNEENNSAAIAIQVNSSPAANQPHIQGISSVTAIQGDRFEILGRQFDSNPDNVSVTLNRNDRLIGLDVLGATESKVVVEMPFIPRSHADLEHKLQLGVGTGAEKMIGQNLDGVTISEPAQLWSGRQVRRTTARRGFRPRFDAPSHKWFHSMPPKEGALSIAIEEDWGEGAIIDLRAVAYLRNFGVEARIDGIRFDSAATRIECARTLCRLLQEAFAAHPSGPMDLECEVISDGARAELVVRSAQEGMAIRSGQIDIMVRDRGNVLYPDFVVDRFGINGPLRFEAGAAIGDRVNLTVANLGKLGVDHQFSVGFYVSQDQSVSTEDSLLKNGRRSVAKLKAGQSTSVALPDDARIPEAFAPGPAYLGVVLDDTRVAFETDELDNSLSLPITVVEPELGQSESDAQAGLSIRSSPNGDVILNWPSSRTLEVAESISGPWIDLPEAGSPFSPPANGRNRFYRLDPVASNDR